MSATARRVTFPAADDGPLLEGILHFPDGPGPFPTAVVCPAHPMYGGTMGDDPLPNIIKSLCHELAAQCWIALRFNFRGAGRSEGTFDNGHGEQNDVGGALDFVCIQEGVNENRIAIMGYSFGAWVGLQHAVRDHRAKYLVGVAPPGDIWKKDPEDPKDKKYSDPFLDAELRPKLFVAGEHDHYAPSDLLREYVTRLKPPKILHFIPGKTHFFSESREREEVESEYSEVATLIVNLLNQLCEYGTQQ